MSGILIVEELAKKAELARQSTDAAKARAAYVNSVRFSIARGLNALALFMDGHEHTCHSSMGPFTVERAVELIVKCWHEPSSYNVSDLAQIARKIRH